MKRLFAFATVLLLTAPAWADWDDGWAAYNSGDYETALEEWLPLAEQGDAKAQSILGWLYDTGEGVPQDYAEALKWYRLAAEQGLEPFKHLALEALCRRCQPQFEVQIR